MEITRHCVFFSFDFANALNKLADGALWIRSGKSSVTESPAENQEREGGVERAAEKKTGAETKEELVEEPGGWKVKRYSPLLWKNVDEGPAPVADGLPALPPESPSPRKWRFGR